MSEKDFLSKIDCKFPYNDILLRNELIMEAIEISPESVFAIIHELARVPHSLKSKVKKDDLFALIHQIDLLFQHPIKNLIIEIAIKMIDNTEVSVNQALVAMEEIKKHRGQWNALNIIYFSCNDIDGKVETKYEEISYNWVHN